MIKVLFLSQWYPNRLDKMYGLFVQKHAEAVSLYCDVATLYVQPDINLTKQQVEIITQEGFTEIIIYFPAGGKSFFARIKKQLNYSKAYPVVADLVAELPYRPEIKYVIDISSRGMRYGHWFLDEGAMHGSK